MALIAKTNLKKEHIYLMQILFAFSVFIASQDFVLKNSLDKESFLKIAHFVLYLLIMKGSEELAQLIHNAVKTRSIANLQKTTQKYLKSIILFTASVLYTCYLNGSLLKEDFLLFTIAFLVIKYLEMEETTAQISYGTGMACSFFEGYLINVIPPDGAQQDGFLGKIRQFEAHNHVVFPVKKLFFIVTEGLHCPTNLKEFNKENKWPYLEACKSLEDVQRDVAGVMRRIYRNSVYKIHRKSKPPVYLAVECPTPLHTLYKVKQHKALYEELLQADYSEIRDDFCSMLVAILARSPDCRGKCQLVYYDPETKFGYLLACCYAEGYLNLVLPASGDPRGSDGIHGNISKFESSNSVVFPVPRLFLIITKYLHCPPNLEVFNKCNRFPRLEVCKNMEKLQINMAGLMKKTFRNSAYKICRAGARPVYLAAECVSLLHSLYRVQQVTLYQERVKVNYYKIRDDFCTMLQYILNKNPDFQNKCELIFYDPEDHSQNLAEILLQRIRQLENNFEIIKRD